MIQDINAPSPGESVDAPQKDAVSQSPVTPDQEAVQPEAPEKDSGSEQPSKGQPFPKRTVLVRYGKVGLIGQFKHNERDLPSVHTKVVVQTDRGLELGEIISPAAAHNRHTCTISREQIDQYVNESGGRDYPFSRNGRMVRIATVQDLNEQRHIDQNIDKEGQRCKELIRELNLQMKLVAIEHLFGGDRIIFFFMAEGRIDFRELVRQLGKEFNTRIEMRQIGARDEAKLVGDFDTCGRELCCKAYLKVLLPVNMRMAKVQRTTLDPSKISGRCGRLKCCLRYENEGYEELEKKLPNVGKLVLSEYGVGTVIDTMVLTQLVKINLKDSGRTIAINVDELLDKAYDPEKSGPPPKPKPIPAPMGMNNGPQLGEPMEPKKTDGKEQSEESRSDSERRSRSRGGRRRGRGRRRSDKDGASQPREQGGGADQSQRSADSGSSSNVAKQEGNSGGEQPRKRRRRRRGGRGRGKQNPDAGSGGSSDS